MSARRSITRRRFLGVAAGAAAAPLVVPSHVLGLGGNVAPSDRIVMGLIGCGGMGNHNLDAFRARKDVQFVALCDVDKQHLENTGKKVPDAKRFADFRELLALQDLNAVVVATPDHWHALCAIAAVRAGKDVYGEKPMTHTFAEGQMLVAAVKSTGAIYQVGSQQRSDWKFRRAVDIVQNGLIGKVKEVQVGLPTGHKKAEGDTKPQDPPAGLDYDFWCGPSEKLEYVPMRVHWNWRWHLSYGGGQLMDWIGHHNDICHWGIGRDRSGPIEVQAKGFEYPEDRRVWNSAWKYEVACKYEDGITTSISNRHRMGAKWIGEGGWVHADRGKLEASNPEWTKREFDPGPKKAYESNDHRANFIDGVKTRKACICDAEIGHRSITPGHLGLLSESMGGKLIRWDPKTETIAGDAEADRKLKSIEYRKPWVLERIA
jgi:predicted dehydrogenase